MFKYKSDLILASKALLASVIAITLTFTWVNAMGMYYVIYTAATISVMQAGTRKRIQFYSMVLAALCFLGLFMLGVYLRPYHLAANLVLPPLAFIAFYLPNLGLTYRISPIMAVIVYLLVMMSPNNPIHPALTSLGIIIAEITAILVYFLVWPECPQDELLLLMLEITEQYRKILQLTMLFSRKTRKSQQSIYLERIEDGVIYCEQHIVNFERIKAYPEIIKSNPKFYNATEDALYGISKITRMFTEILPHMSDKKVKVFLPFIKDICQTLRYQENQLSHDFHQQVLQRRFIHKSWYISKKLLKFITPRHPSQKNIMTQTEFERELLKIVKPLDASPQKRAKNDMSLQLAFGLLRIKELYMSLGRAPHE